MSGPGRGSLPAELSRFVGRREVSQVRRLLESNRLVTLTGLGGAGKTRLAMQVAQSVRRSFGDGVWLVELAAVSDAELVASAVAGVLGVADRAERSALSALAAYLEDKRLLLVLDNCEHLLTPCAAMADKLLSAGPRLQILATSREPLRICGEQVLPVPPLPVPVSAGLPPEDLIGSEAVQLFVQRAQEVVPSFQLTRANAGAVAAVCRRVEGIPLAIELAAARIRVLAPEQILDRLDERFRLLTRGPRVAPARHRTLAATMDWSYELCSPAEQLLWARMSVFAGGFDLDAAQHVCAGDGIHQDQMFELVTGLIDKSILIRDRGVGMTARYGLLETVREYGRQRLTASGREQAAPERHRQYYRDLARRAQSDRVSPHEVESLERLRREWSNLRAAMTSALAQPGTTGAAVEIAVALRDLWFGAGRHREGLHWLTRALAADERPTPARAVALSEASYLAMRLGDPQTGERMLAEANALADQLGDPDALLAVIHARSTFAINRRPPDLALARSLSEQVLAQAGAAGDLRRVSNALMQLAALATITGDADRAADYAEQCRALAESRDAEWTKAWALITLAEARWAGGAREQVASLVHRALPVHRHVRDSYATERCLQVLSWTATTAGDYQRAARLLGACHAVKRLNGTAAAQQGLFAGHHDQCVRDVRQALGEDAYLAAFDETARFTLDEAIGYALAEHRMTSTPETSRRARPEPSPLTPREQQIAELVAEGLTSKQIAARLVISQRTVEGHVDHILTKLGFTNRAQIARWITQRKA